MSKSTFHSNPEFKATWMDEGSDLYPPDELERMYEAEAKAFQSYVSQLGVDVSEDEEFDLYMEWLALQT